MRRTLQGALFALALGTPAFALAQEGTEAAQHVPGPGPEGGPGFPGADVHEEAEHGIINWWSWDYGEKPKDPTHKGWPPPFGYALINFGIFAAIMYRLAAKPLRNFVKDRHERIGKDLTEAAELRKKAEAKLREYEDKVKNAEAEITSLLTQIQKEAEADKARIIAAAEEQAKKLKADAQRQIEAEIARARAELRAGVIEAAASAADQLVRQQIGADDQRKMAERYVAELESAQAATTAKGRA